MSRKIKNIHVREQNWAEIHDLVLFKNGPLSNRFREMAAQMMEDESDEEAQIILETLRVEYIAFCCAIIASHNHGEYKNAPPSMILAAWAGNAMQQETESTMKAILEDEEIGPMLKMLIDRLRSRQDEE